MLAVLDSLAFYQRIHTTAQTLVVLHDSRLELGWHRRLYERSPQSKP
jgi:hypothetical protein